jgi:hypothetical protein
MDRLLSYLFAEIKSPVRHSRVEFTTMHSCLNVTANSTATWFQRLRQGLQTKRGLQKGVAHLQGGCLAHHAQSLIVIAGSSRSSSYSHIIIACCCRCCSKNTANPQPCMLVAALLATRWQRDKKSTYNRAKIQKKFNE